ncbi:TetR family transcriptional regulator [Kribbella sp. CA-253562]|uniref:TetR family transcriptional regulator n=1 Tax=Kribbella sp. CA-253562 TaxID=3239942 RepID=UPI003D8C0A7A
MSTERPRRGRPPATDGEATRERILRIAAETFASHGYHGTGVAQLGEATGLQRGALYYHIKSKEDLLFDLSKRHVEEALTRGRPIVESDLPPVQKFRELAREHLTVITKRQAEVRVVLREMQFLTGKRATALNKLREEYEGLFATVLKEGAATGVFSEPDIVTTHAILGMYNSTSAWFSPKAALTAPELADRLSDIVLDGIMIA